MFISLSLSHSVTSSPLELPLVQPSAHQGVCVLGEAGHPQHCQLRHHLLCRRGAEAASNGPPDLQPYRQIQRPTDGRPRVSQHVPILKAWLRTSCAAKYLALPMVH